MALFNIFANQDYTFLELEACAGGVKIVSETTAQGIVKLRDGMTQTGEAEAYNSSSTVHIKPDEAFVTSLKNLVGHGIRVLNDAGEALEYRITGQIEGYDFETNALDFYKVTLKREGIVECPSVLPLT